MTQTFESSTTMPVARRRASSALPVLISIPSLAVSTPSPKPRVRRRRRLRREVRAVGYALLIVFPLSVALVTFGGDKFPAAAPTLVVERSATSPESSDALPVRISLAPLEPVLAADREMDTPVFLRGDLLPADAAEESSDGGH